MPPQKGYHRVYDLIAYAMNSIANLAIVPMQDYLLLSNEEGRMNEPSTAQGNWNWRLSARYNTVALRNKVLAVTKETKRTK